MYVTCRSSVEHEHVNQTKVSNKYLCFLANYLVDVWYIDNFNSLNHLYTLTENNFADLTNEEFKLLGV